MSETGEDPKPKPVPSFERDLRKVLLKHKIADFALVGIGLAGDIHQLWEAGEGEDLAEDIARFGQVSFRMDLVKGQMVEYCNTQLRLANTEGQE